MATGEPVLILTGAPGAGKTTVARMLAALGERSVHVEADRFFGFIESGYVDPSRPESHAQNVLVMDTVAKAAAGYASGGYFTIVEGIVLPRWFLEPLRNALQAAGHAVAFAVLRPPLDVCLSRADSRDVAIVERYWRELAELGPLERHAIDVAGEDPGAVAGLIAGRLREGTLAL